MVVKNVTNGPTNQRTNGQGVSRSRMGIREHLYILDHIAFIIHNFNFSIEHFLQTTTWLYFQFSRTLKMFFCVNLLKRYWSAPSRNRCTTRGSPGRGAPTKWFRLEQKEFLQCFVMKGWKWMVTETFQEELKKTASPWFVCFNRVSSCAPSTTTSTFWTMPSLYTGSHTDVKKHRQT